VGEVPKRIAKLDMQLFEGAGGVSVRVRCYGQVGPLNLSVPVFEFSLGDAPAGADFPLWLTDLLLKLTEAVIF
jgi:hypothetical protein